MNEERNDQFEMSDSITDDANRRLMEIRAKETHARRRKERRLKAKRGYDRQLIAAMCAAALITVTAGAGAVQMMVPDDSPSTGITFEAVKPHVKEPLVEEKEKARAEKTIEIADARLMKIEETDSRIDTTSNDAEIIYSTTVTVEGDDELEYALRLADEEQLRHEAALNAIRKAEADKNRTIQIAMNAHSVDRDLKIQFTDDVTGKLINGVPLSVSVSPEGGIGVLYDDEDKDGVIHLTDLDAGDYTLSQTPITDPDFARYRADASGRKVSVNGEIVYEMVDVTGLYEREDEVDYVTEDSATARKEKEASTEPLKDTVKFLASSKTEVSAGKGEREDIVEYRKISVSDIADPDLNARLTSLSGKLVFFSAPETFSVDVGEDTSSTMFSVPVIDQTEYVGTGDDMVDIGSSSTTNADRDDSTVSVSTAPPQETVDVTAPERKEDEPVAGNASSTGSKSTSETLVDIDEPEDDEEEEDEPEEEDTSGDEEKAPEKEKKYSPDEKLKDTSGKQVYVRNSVGHYVAATGADLEKYDTFYIRIDTVKYYKYAGWQTIQGTTYYYDETGSRVTGDQVIQGVAYTFRADGSLSTGGGIIGVDVSRFNKDIDWSQVRNAGVSFAIIRCGYRGSTGGNLIEDYKFRENIQGATQAGIRVGVYFVTQAVSEAEAIEEASMVVSLIKGYHISLPVFADSEASGGRGDAIDTATRTATIKAFCRTMSNAGYRSGVYASTNWMNHNLNISELSDYSIWVAQYNNIPTYTKTKYDIWQYSSHGRLPGVSTEIDMNIMYSEY